MAKEPIIGAAISQLRGLASRVRDLTNVLDNATKSAVEFENQMVSSAEKASRAVEDLGNEVDRTSRKMTGIGGMGKKVAQGFDNFAKSLIKVNTAIVGMGIGLLIDGISRVIELKERWARITGQMTQKIGALTPNFRGMMKASREAQGVIRGLTDNFELGAQMFGEYSQTLETTGASVMKYNRVWLQMARGMDLGATGAGELVKSFRALGVSAPEVSQMMVQMTKDADILGVNSQAVARDLTEAGDMMARFGREGTKSLVQGAVFLKQFNIGLKDTKGLMDTFDRFDSATEATAKLNTIFGTTISSMDMLLAQDPAERIERVRQELLAQGKTFETLSGFERKTLAETLSIGEKEVAFLLDQEKAHISLADFRAKAAKQEVSEARAQKQMQRQLQKTSEVLFAWGIAMDRITVAIGKALMPLLDALGLKTGGYGKKMSSLTDVIVRFFEELSKSGEWIDLMQKLADVMKRVAATVKDFVMSGKIGPWIDTIVSGLKSFVKWSGLLITAWTGAKAARFLFNVGSIAGKFLGMSSGAVTTTGGIPAGVTGAGGNAIPASAIGPATPLGGGRARLARMAAGASRMGGGLLMGAGIGAGIGTLTGGNAAGGAVGGAIGGAIGMIGGPLVSAIGSALGGWLGAHGGRILDKVIDRGAAKGESFAQGGVRKQTERNEEIERRMGSARLQSAMVEQRLASKRKIEDATLGIILSKQGKKIKLDEDERQTVLKLASDMQALGIKSGFTNAELTKLADPKGPVVVTREQMNALGGHVDLLRSKTEQAANEILELAGASRLLKEIEIEEAKIKNKEMSENVKRDSALNKLRLVGEKELADKIKDVGFAEGMREFSDSAQETTDEIANIEKMLASVDEDSFFAPPPGLIKANKEQLEVLKKKRKKDEEILGITGPLMRSDQQLLKLKEKQLKFDEKKLELEAINLALQAELPVDKLQKLRQLGPLSFLISPENTAGLSSDQIKTIGKLAEVKRSIESVTNEKLAAGGIVTRPTMAMVGEAGPEAVIPLRAIASGRGRQPMKFGGSAAKKLVNYAAGKGDSGSQQVHVVAGDVYLDGAKVGRHIVRNALSNSNF